jgi:hypothetical protein
VEEVERVEVDPRPRLDAVRGPPEGLDRRPQMSGRVLRDPLNDEAQAPVELDGEAVRVLIDDPVVRDRLASVDVDAEGLELPSKDLAALERHPGRVGREKVLGALAEGLSGARRGDHACRRRREKDTDR